MRYLRWTAPRLLPLGFAELLTEISDLGYVLMEIGLNATGQVIHRMPDDDYEHGQSPYFESSPIDVDLVLASGVADEISAETFHVAWKRADRLRRWGQTEDDLRWVLSQVTMDEGGRFSVEDYLDHNELGLAWETIWFYVPNPDSEVAARLAQAGQRMGLGDHPASGSASQRADLPD
jgi:hypothetical protein